MILLSFRREPETRGETWPCSEFRWTLQSNLSREWFSFGFVHQYRDRATGKWGDSHTNVYCVEINRYPRWGSSHFYYDGPHCIFSMGPVHFQWSNWKCRQCLGKESAE